MVQTDEGISSTNGFDSERIEVKIISKSGDHRTLSVNAEELRAILSSLRESLEVIEDREIVSRLGVAEAGVITLEGELDAVYRMRGRSKEISVTGRKLTTIRNALQAALEIEDWEFHPRMGFTKAEVRSILAEVSRLVSA